MDKISKNGLDQIKLNIETLKKLFPECVSEGKIDFDVLKTILGDYVNNDKEIYQFQWVGKRKTIFESLNPSVSTLIPCKEKSVDWDKTENIFIEGDNLEVLKTISKTYHSKIKLIFIDPPYNTGNDFIYNDNFEDSVANYKNITNQQSTTNPEYSGRFHTDWLNMMYSRLRIAKELLTEDGSIFISIDYNEIANLRKIMDEIFGENNFQREIIWRIGWLSGYKTTAPNFIRNHDTILFYSKNSSEMYFNKTYIKNEDFKPLLKEDSDTKSKLINLGIPESKIKDLFEFINHGNRTDKYALEDTWNCNEYDDLNSIAIVSFSGEKISKILNINQDFKGQKSIKMIQRIIESITLKGDIVMDFFAGTASTAHAVMDFNSYANKKLKFIMVQLPELTEEGSEAKKAGYKTICDIAEARLKTVSKIISENVKRKYNKIDLLNKESVSPNEFDFGFKVFKLDSTNIIPWDGTIKHDENSILELTDVIKEGRTDLDVAYEIMLKYGVFDKQLTEKKINNKKVFSVDNDSMIIYLNDTIDENDTKEIIKLKPSVVVFKESCFNNDDNLKINTEHTLKHYLGEDNIKVLCI